MNKPIVLNTGPLIAFGKIGVLDLLRQLPFDFKTTDQVLAEITAGAALGYPVGVPKWVEVVSTAQPPSRLVLANLDAGEASVIESALQRNISDVCIDELKGRRAAIASGLPVTGSLGLLGKPKNLRLIDAVRPLVEKAQNEGIYYHPALIARFLKSTGE